MKRFSMICLLLTLLAKPLWAGEVCSNDPADPGFVRLVDKGQGRVGFEYCLRNHADGCFRVGSPSYSRASLQAKLVEQQILAKKLDSAHSAAGVFSVLSYGGGAIAKAPFLAGLGLGGAVATRAALYFVNREKDRAEMLATLLHGSPGCFEFARDLSSVREMIREALETVEAPEPPTVADNGTAKIIMGAEISTGSSKQGSKHGAH